MEPGSPLGSVYSFADIPHRPVTRPGCVGLSALRIHSDEVAGADEVAGLFVVELRFEPGGEMDEHDADHPILFIVTAGAGTVSVGGVERPIRAGQSSYWPAGALHKVTAGAGGLTAIVVEYNVSSRDHE